MPRRIEIACTLTASSFVITKTRNASMSQMVSDGIEDVKRVPFCILITIKTAATVNHHNQWETAFAFGQTDCAGQSIAV